MGGQTKKLVVDSFYAMFTLRQVQRALGCSRATLYRTLKKAGIERYYIPNHPGSKYIWGCSLYKLAKTPVARKAMKRCCVTKTLPEYEIEKISKVIGMSIEHARQSVSLGWIPLFANEVPWWYEKAVKGMLKLPLPFK